MNIRTPEQDVRAFFRVYSRTGTFLAALLFAEDAAAVAAANGHGSTVRSPAGKIVWHEGRELCSGRRIEQAANLIRANMHGGA